MSVCCCGHSQRTIKSYHLFVLYTDYFVGPRDGQASRTSADRSQTVDHLLSLGASSHQCKLQTSRKLLKGTLGIRLDRTSPKSEFCCRNNLVHAVFSPIVTQENLLYFCVNYEQGFNLHKSLHLETFETLVANKTVLFHHAKFGILLAKYTFTLLCN